MVDKPAGWTSHDVVAKVRGILGTRKVGHAGTLDPSATGVLVLGVGRGTRLLSYVTDGTKSYVGEIVLGVETDSLDADGEVTRTHRMEPPEPEAVAAAAADLTGDLLQVPPMVSAVRIGGRRLHELARAGVTVERPPRPVRVNRFEVAATDDPMVLRAEVDCSAGTYIRVLAADLGAALGGGAHLRNLRRTRVGAFTLEMARPLDQLELLPIESVFPAATLVRVDADVAAEARHGRVLPLERLGVSGAGPWPVVGPEGNLLAVYELHRGGTVKPALVLAP